MSTGQVCGSIICKLSNSHEIGHLSPACCTWTIQKPGKQGACPPSEVNRSDQLAVVSALLQHIFKLDSQITKKESVACF
jgi:hypothetical protein